MIHFPTPAGFLPRHRSFREVPLPLSSLPKSFAAGKPKKHINGNPVGLSPVDAYGAR
jgi:hypothetical protein